jgi:hypothetical protein
VVSSSGQVSRTSHLLSLQVAQVEAVFIFGNLRGKATAIFLVVFLKTYKYLLGKGVGVKASLKRSV